MVMSMSGTLVIKPTIKFHIVLVIRPGALNAAALKNENPYAVLTKKTYDSNDQAGQQIDQHDIENGLPKVNLGSNIHGTIDSAAGSEYLTWNEGRWNLTVHADRVANEDATQLGKQTVQL